MSLAKTFVVDSELEYFDQQFFDSLNELERDSSVGNCSLKLYGSTIGEALGWDGQSYNLDRLRYLRACVRQRWESLLKGELVADTLKVFVKQEPHKKSKLDEERYRLIMGVSVVDTMVDRLILGPVFRKVLQLAGVLPTWIGWTPLKSGLRCFKVKTRGKRLCVDKSAWDWTVPNWLLNYVRIIIEQLHPDAPDWWKCILRRRFKLLFEDAIFEFQDGVRIKQQFPGIQKSGSYGTIFVNSLSQVFVHNLIQEWKDLQPTMIKALGDDTDQESNDQDKEYIDGWISLGFDVKWEVLDIPEFCGFRLGQECYPVYVDKHAFVLQHLTLDPDIAVSFLRSYQLMYYAEPEKLSFIRKIIKARNLPEAYVTDQYLRSIVDY